MIVRKIYDERGLEAIRPAWESLLHQSAADTIFLTWEWVTAWWKAYGNPGELCILAAFDEGETLRGIAPLRRSRARRCGQAVSCLSFAGDGSNDSEYLDFIIAAGWEQPVMEAFRAYWREAVQRGAVLLLNEIPSTSPCLPLLEAIAARERLRLVQAETPCGTVGLPETWDDYLRLLRPRFRTKVRSVLRELGSRPEIQFGFADSREEVARMLPVLYDLHARRWALQAKPGVFGWQKKRDFYSILSPLLVERGWLRFSWLRWKDSVLACQYGFAYKGRYFHLQEGYEPASEHWNCGIGLRAWTIREFIAQGIREYDFLGGVGRHKNDWGAETKHSRHLELAGVSALNFVFCHGPAWRQKARQSIAAAVPNSLLMARRERLLDRERRASAAQSAPASRDWLLKAGAACYFHGGLAALAAPWRARYQLKISHRGPSFSRRTEPAGRILYYHRVNDERDPFFPALPTALFEQQMRFVARWYKVVGLGQLVEHLRSGPPELRFAITFDDGYQDNYHNALPILERYRLPATIFLATGSLDSRQPLWFETLAQAIKRTSREHIDLEVDLPRRFWMRTPAERLSANDAIYGILRALPDSERRQWLAHFLRLLGEWDNGERCGRMLTWEQVRLMKSRGIDFGGHTVTHPFLSRLKPEEIRWEVSECKRRIEEETQAPADYFAYPSGRENDFGLLNKDLIRAAGYHAAVTTIWGMNYRSTDPMELRRGQPWEEDPARFAYKLDWYQFMNN